MEILKTLTTHEIVNIVSILLIIVSAINMKKDKGFIIPLLIGSGGLAISILSGDNILSRFL